MMISYNIDIFFIKSAGKYFSRLMQCRHQSFFIFLFDEIFKNRIEKKPIGDRNWQFERMKFDNESLAVGGGLLFIIFWAVNRYAVTQLLIGQVDVAFDTVIGCRCCLFPCLFVFCCVLKNSRFYFVVSDFRTGSPAVGPNPRCLPDFSHSGSTFWVF